MIPVFRLGDLQKRPNDPNARARAIAMVKELKESDEAFKRVCKEQGIPYVPAVCADIYGYNYYTTGAGRLPTPKLGGNWFNRQ